MEFEGCETWSFVNADMFPPPVNTLSVVIGACRVISEYSHFLAKLQAPANMLRAWTTMPPCVNYTNISLFHTISHNAAAHASSQLQEYALWWVVSCLLQMIFDHSQVTSHLSQVMFVPCITKRIQQHRVTRRKSLLLMVGCVLSRRPTPVLSQSVKTPMHHMRTQVALKDLARPKVNKYGKKKRD